MTVGIIGGGIMGISLGYFLSQQGVQGRGFRSLPCVGRAGRSHRPRRRHGGGPFLPCHSLQRQHSAAGCSELGIADQLRFRQTKMGFYYNGGIRSMNNVMEFLRFPRWAGSTAFGWGSPCFPPSLSVIGAGWKG